VGIHSSVFHSMLIGRWLPYIAAIGIALAGTVYAQPVSNDSGGQPRTRETQPKPQADNHPLNLDTIEREIERIARALEAAIKTPKPADETERAQRDLIAQEGMAHWAKWMFWASLASVLLTLVGVFLIWRTLIHTRSAAKAAADAVIEARLATQAANKAIEITAENAERELRAYVDISSAEITDRINGADWEEINSLQIALKNFGQTPAYDLRCWTLASLRDLPPREPFEEGELIMFGNVGPSVLTFPRVKVTVRADQVGAVMQRAKGIFYWGFVSYRDAFNRTRTLKFKFLSTGQSYAAKKFQPYEATQAD
jgi:hypothetical protein